METRTEAGEGRRDQIVRQLSLSVPVVALVLAFTAVPVEFRRPAVVLGDIFRPAITYSSIPDIVFNILGYIPVGITLAGLGWRAIGAAAIVSLAAETSQLFSGDRSPSILDLATNILGAALGYAIAAWFRIESPTIRIERRAASLAAVLASAYVAFGAHITFEDVEELLRVFKATMTVPTVPLNQRGASAPGILEAHWTFDDSDDRLVSDTTGNGVDGALVNGGTFTAGVDGTAIELNGMNQFVAIGDPLSLRLTGSMTIAAWVNSSVFPVDDSAIVSARNDKFLGYQLDTTSDAGPRTIGFKLADRFGRLLIRYGKTPLRTGAWYHLAGVYDAQARTLDVYLNGRLDSGCLLGTVTTAQHLAGEPVYVGRRARPPSSWFGGLIDDVRIYSKALTPDEIQRELVGAAPGVSWRSAGTPVSRESLEEGPCPAAEPTDSRSVGMYVVLGMLIAVACIGLWPTPASWVPSILLSVVAGFLLFPSIAAIWPGYFRAFVPLLTLAGSASILIAARRTLARGST